MPRPYVSTTPVLDALRQRKLAQKPQDIWDVDELLAETKEFTEGLPVNEAATNRTLAELEASQARTAAFEDAQKLQPNRNVGVIGALADSAATPIRIASSFGGPLAGFAGEAIASGLESVAYLDGKKMAPGGSIGRDIGKLGARLGLATAFGAANNVVGPLSSLATRTGTSLAARLAGTAGEVLAPAALKGAAGGIEGGALNVTQGALTRGIEGGDPWDPAGLAMDVGLGTGIGTAAGAGLGAIEALAGRSQRLKGEADAVLRQQIDAFKAAQPPEKVPEWQARDMESWQRNQANMGDNIKLRQPNGGTVRGPAPRSRMPAPGVTEYGGAAPTAPLGPEYPVDTALATPNPHPPLALPAPGAGAAGPTARDIIEGMRGEAPAEAGPQPSAVGDILAEMNAPPSPEQMAREGGPQELPAGRYPAGSPEAAAAQPFTPPEAYPTLEELLGMADPMQADVQRMALEQGPQTDVSFEPGPPLTAGGPGAFDVAIPPKVGKGFTSQMGAPRRVTSDGTTITIHYAGGSLPMSVEQFYRDWGELAGAVAPPMRTPQPGPDQMVLGRRPAPEVESSTGLTQPPEAAAAEPLPEFPPSQITTGAADEDPLMRELLGQVGEERRAGIPQPGETVTVMGREMMWTGTQWVPTRAGGGEGLPPTGGEGGVPPGGGPPEPVAPSGEGGGGRTVDPTTDPTMRLGNTMAKLQREHGADAFRELARLQQSGELSAYMAVADIEARQGQTGLPEGMGQGEGARLEDAAQGGAAPEDDIEAMLRQADEQDAAASGGGTVAPRGPVDLRPGERRLRHSSYRPFDTFSREAGASAGRNDIGHWFTDSDTAHFGPIDYDAAVTLENPYHVGTREKLAAEIDAAGGPEAYVRKMQEAGHDGVTLTEIGPDGTPLNSFVPFGDDQARILNRTMRDQAGFDQFASPEQKAAWEAGQRPTGEGGEPPAAPTPVPVKPAPQGPAGPAGAQAAPEGRLHGPISKENAEFAELVRARREAEEAAAAAKAAPDEADKLITPARDIDKIVLDETTTPPVKAEDLFAGPTAVGEDLPATPETPAAPKPNLPETEGITLAEGDTPGTINQAGKFVPLGDDWRSHDPAANKNLVIRKADGTYQVVKNNGGKTPKKWNKDLASIRDNERVAREAKAKAKADEVAAKKAEADARSAAAKARQEAAAAKAKAAGQPPPPPEPAEPVEPAAPAAAKPEAPIGPTRPPVVDETTFNGVPEVGATFERSPSKAIREVLTKHGFKATYRTGHDPRWKKDVPKGSTYTLEDVKDALRAILRGEDPPLLQDKPAAPKAEAPAGKPGEWAPPAGETTLLDRPLSADNAEREARRAVLRSLGWTQGKVGNNRSWHAPAGPSGPGVPPANPPQAGAPSGPSANVASPSKAPVGKPKTFDPEHYGEAREYAKEQGRLTGVDHGIAYPGTKIEVRPLPEGPRWSGDAWAGVDEFVPAGDKESSLYYPGMGDKDDSTRWANQYEPKATDLDHRILMHSLENPRDRMKDFAAALGVPLKDVRERMKVMQDAQLIESINTTPHVSRAGRIVADRKINPRPKAPAAAPASSTPPGRTEIRIAADQIKIDPDAYQFKGGTDERGRTSKLKGVEEWDVDSGMAERVILHKRLDGSYYVVDGHQRVGLAQDLLAQGKEVPDLYAVVWDEAAGVTVADARRGGAMRNLVSGTTDPVDIARVLRSGEFTPAEQRRVGKIEAESGEKFRQGRDLAALEDAAFAHLLDMEELDPKFARLVSQYKGAELQEALLDLLGRNRDLPNISAAKSLLAKGAAQLTEETQGDIFGKLTRTANAEAMVKFEQSILSVFKKNRRTFGGGAKNAEVLQQAGSTVIDKAAMSKIGYEARRAEELFDKFVNAQGSHTMRALKEMFDEHHAGNVSLGKAADRVAEALEADVRGGPGPGGPGAGPTGGEGPGASGEEGPSLFGGDDDGGTADEWSEADPAGGLFDDRAVAAGRQEASATDNVNATIDDKAKAVLASARRLMKKLGDERGSLPLDLGDANDGLPALEATYKRNPGAVLTALRTAGGGLVGAMLAGEDDENLLDNILIGAAAGYASKGAWQFSKAAIKAAPTLTKHLADTINTGRLIVNGTYHPIPVVRQAPDRMKDIGGIAMKFWSPDKVIPDVWKHIEPIMRDLYDLEGKETMTPFQRRLARRQKVDEALAHLDAEGQRSRDLGHHRRLKYVEELKNELTNKPTWIEDQIRDLTGGKITRKQVQQGNAIVTNAIYHQLLGWGIDSGLANMTQALMNIPQIGVDSTVRGIIKAYSKEGRQELKFLDLARRQMGHDSATDAMFHPWVEKYLEYSQTPMRWSDSANRRATWAGAQHYAQKRGMSKEAADDFARMLVGQTQGIAGDLGNNPFHRHWGPLKVFTKYPFVWASMLEDVARHPDPRVKMRFLAMATGIYAASAISGIEWMNFFWPRMGGLPGPSAAYDVLEHSFGAPEHDFEEHFEPGGTEDRILPRFITKGANILERTATQGDRHQIIGRKGEVLRDISAEEDLLSLLGIETTEREATRKQESEMYEFSQEAKREESILSRRRRRRAGVALASGDVEGARTALEALSRRQRKAFESGRLRSNRERARRLTPLARRAEFDEQFEDQ